MKITITGGGGFIGRKLAARLLAAGRLAGRGGPAALEELVLFDQTAPPEGEFDDGRVRVVTGDLGDPARLEAVIGPDGRVTDVKVLRSVPLLDEAALNAVRQWTYTPTLLNGLAVPVIMTVTVNFQLR